MKRSFRLLIRLYPKAWRQRYEFEFAALLDDVRPCWGALFDVFKSGIAMQLKMISGFKVIAITSLLGLVVGVGTWLEMRDEYVSAALFELQPQPSADQIKSLVKPAWSKSALARIIDRYELYRELRSTQPIEKVIAEMKDDIQIRPAGKNGMTLQFRYYDRPLAQQVCMALVEALMAARGSHVTIELLNAPDLPDRPVSPNPMRRATSGFVAGIVIGLPFVFFRPVQKRT